MFTFIGGTSGAALNGFGNTASTPTVSTIGADLLVAVVSDQLSSAASVLSDSLANAWTLALEVDTAGCSRCRVFWALPPPAKTGAAHTFSINGVNSFGSLAVLAFKGSVLAAPVDQQASNFAAGTNTRIGPPITPTLANELVIEAISEGATAGSVVTIDSGFLGLQQQSGAGGINFGCAIAFKIQTAAALISPNWAATATSICGAIAASFKSRASVSSTGVAGSSGAGLSTGDNPIVVGFANF